MNITFPDDFIWGTCSNGYMTEGGITADNWSPFIKTDQELPFDERRFAEPVGQACDYWNRYDEDHALAEKLGVQIHRMSVEWSRVEPEEGQFDKSTIKHYGEMLDNLHEHHVQTMLTLNHFIIPNWVELQGGYLNHTFFIEKYRRYVRKIVEALGDKVDYWLPINEPNVVPSGYYIGFFPPFKSGLRYFIQAYRLMLDMHASSYHIIKEYHPKSPVGVAFNWAYMRPFREKNIWDRLGAWFNNRGSNEVFFDAVKQGRLTFPIGLGGKFQPMKNSLDFIGLNYYCCHFCKGFTVHDTRPGHPVTDRGRAIWPEGMYRALKHLDENFNLPIIITENGVATTDEDFRIKHMAAHLAQVHRAMQENVPVKGYMHWSLTDNWEWTWGFKMRFGLIHIDYDSQKRTIKKSGKWYADVINRSTVAYEGDLGFVQGES